MSYVTFAQLWYGTRLEKMLYTQMSGREKNPRKSESEIFKTNNTSEQYID